MKKDKKALLWEIAITCFLVLISVTAIVLTTSSDSVTPKSYSEISQDDGMDNVDIEIKEHKGGQLTGKVMGASPTIDQERTPFKQGETISVKLADDDTEKVKDVKIGQHVVVKVDPSTKKEDGKQVINDVKFVEIHNSSK